jgi:hypothetical protein
MAPRKPAAPKAATTPAPVETIETVAEAALQPDVVDADEADAVEEDAQPQPMPQEISDKVTTMTFEGEIGRIDIWLSETRYLLSQLEHDHVGPRGEIIAYLKARL